MKFWSVQACTYLYLSIIRLVLPLFCLPCPEKGQNKMCKIDVAVKSSVEDVYIFGCTHPLFDWNYLRVDERYAEKISRSFQWKTALLSLNWWHNMSISVCSKTKKKECSCLCKEVVDSLLWVERHSGTVTGLPPKNDYRSISTDPCSYYFASHQVRWTSCFSDMKIRTGYLHLL